MIGIHVYAVAAGPQRLQFKVAHQQPRLRNLLPFRARNGVEIRESPSRPFVAVVGGRLVVGLRGLETPDTYRSAPVSARVPDARSAATAIKAAAAELRQVFVSRRSM